jgi:hypothetical protein
MRTGRHLVRGGHGRGRLGDWARGTYCGVGLVTAGIGQNVHVG